MALAAGQSAAAVLGFGTVVSIGGPTGATGSEVYTVISEVKDIKDSGRKLGTTQTTNFDSLGIQQDTATILDLGTLTLTVSRKSNDPGQMAVIAAQLTRQAYDFKVQLPKEPLLGQTTTGDLYTLSAIITEAGAFDVSMDKASEYTIALKVNSYTFTAGA